MCHRICDTGLHDFKLQVSNGSFKYMCCQAHLHAPVTGYLVTGNDTRDLLPKI